MDLHLFVALAILGQCREVLLEYEYADLKVFLHRLPEMDMGKIIAQARNLQHQLKRELDTVPNVLRW